MKFCLMRSKHERYVNILSGRHTAVSAVLFNYNTVRYQYRKIGGWKKQEVSLLVFLACILRFFFCSEFLIIDTSAGVQNGR
jgi:hypothetical protein